MVNFNYRRVPAVAVRQAADRGRQARRDPPLAGGLPPGLDQRPELPARLAAAEGAGRLRRARRHRRPHHRSRPLPRRADHRGRRHAGDLHQGAAARDGDRRRRRPRPRRPATEMGEVTVDDSTTFLARFENGATGTFEATRLAPGRRNYNSFEINGSNGSDRLQPGAHERAAGLLRRRSRPGCRASARSTSPRRPPLHRAWWPAGHIIGYEHTFVHAIKDLLDGIKAGKSPAPTFEDGYAARPSSTPSSGPPRPARGRHQRRSSRAHVSGPRPGRRTSGPDRVAISQCSRAGRTPRPTAVRRRIGPSDGDAAQPPRETL